MISDVEVVKFLDDFLSIDEIEDESENGVQVDAPSKIKKIAFAVDVRKDIVDRAVEIDADLLFVHHGLIWGGGIKKLVGREYDMVRSLIRNDIGLYGAHLPLDVHPEVGNNVLLAETIDAEVGEPFIEYQGTKIARMADFHEKRKVEDIAEELKNKLDTDTFVLRGKEEVKKIGILTGKGGQALSGAKENGAQLFITGERTYMAYNEALDLNMPLIFAGHYATETLGVKKIKELLEERFDVGTEFLASKTSI